VRLHVNRNFPAGIERDYARGAKHCNVTFLSKLACDAGLLALKTANLLISSIKEEVKKEHISFGWSFSCSAARLIERDLF
jgi:hypothetical protein